MNIIDAIAGKVKRILSGEYILYRYTERISGAMVYSAERCGGSRMDFNGLKRQYNALREEIFWRVERVTEEGRYTGGSEIMELEERLAEYVGVSFCVSCGSGSDALALMLTAAGIGAGDAVFVPDLTSFAVAEAVSRIGAEPVFVQPDGRTYNMCPRELGHSIEEYVGEARPRAVLAADMFGLPANHQALERVAEKHGLILFEDAAQSLGAQSNGKRAGSFGVASAISFSPEAPLGCWGDGGAVLTCDRGLAERVRSLGGHGRGPDGSVHTRIGYGSRLDRVQAAVLLAKLEAFRRCELPAVRRAAALYEKRLQGMEGIVLPFVPEGVLPAWRRYNVRLASSAEREEAQRRLQRAGIPSEAPCVRAVSRQPVYAGRGSSERTCADALCETLLSLPMHPYITEGEIAEVCGILSGDGEK